MAWSWTQHAINYHREGNGLVFDSRYSEGQFVKSSHITFMELVNKRILKFGNEWDGTEGRN